MKVLETEKTSFMSYEIKYMLSVFIQEHDIKGCIIAEYVSSILLSGDKNNVPIGPLTQEHPFASMNNVSIFTHEDVIMHSVDAWMWQLL